MKIRDLSDQLVRSLSYSCIIKFLNSNYFVSFRKVTPVRYSFDKRFLRGDADVMITGWAQFHGRYYVFEIHLVWNEAKNIFEFRYDRRKEVYIGFLISNRSFRLSYIQSESFIEDIVMSDCMIPHYTWQPERRYSKFKD